MKKHVLTVLILLLICIIVLPTIPVKAGEISGVETPPENLGVIDALTPVKLSFNVTFGEATGSTAILILSYDVAGWVYSGFEAYMDGVNVTDQFEETVDTGEVTLTGDNLSPANGTLTMNVLFTSTFIEGNYTFAWEYHYIAYQPPPSFPTTEEGSGFTYVYVEVPPPEVTVLETPPANLGNIPINTLAKLPFKARIENSQLSNASFTVIYDVAGWVYSGFEAYMDGVNVTDQFEETVDTGEVTLTGDNLSPANGLLDVKIWFKAQVEGNYTFTWNYCYNASIPTLLVSEAGSGESDATVVLGEILTLNLVRGYNLVGISVEPLNPSIESVFAGNLDKIVSIEAFYNGVHYAWPKKPGALELNEVHAGMGLIVEAKTAFTQEIIGIVPEEKPTLTRGWSLIAVVGLESVETEEYLNGEDWILVWGYIEEARLKVFRWPGYGPLTTLEPGEGYWVKIS